jgi:acetyltransferase-like isoleucine patch superfamily enzyme
MRDVLFILPRPQHPQYLGPGLHLGWRFGWMRGWMVRPLWKIRELFGGSRVRVGQRFCLMGKLIARGSGEVVLGDDCIVADACTLTTRAKEAKILIGSRTFLNGTRFDSAIAIEVGDDCILADARIFDHDFHTAAPPASNKIKIANNVWIAAGAAVLCAVEIGEDSVVGFGSIVSNTIPAGKIAAGNPAVVVGNVPE